MKKNIKFLAVLIVFHIFCPNPKSFAQPTTTINEPVPYAISPQFKTDVLSATVRLLNDLAYLYSLNPDVFRETLEGYKEMLKDADSNNPEDTQVIDKLLSEVVVPWAHSSYPETRNK